MSVDHDVGTNLDDVLKGDCDSNGIVAVHGLNENIIESWTDHGTGFYFLDEGVLAINVWS